MPAIGITGGISTGKSTFCAQLRGLMPGAKFFDADSTARHLVDADPGVRGEMVREFGASVYQQDGSLNRAKVRAIITADAAKKRGLEEILHPRIRRQWSAQAEAHRDSSEFFFADIPLLYETAGEKLCDRVVVVACSPELQLGRLLRRGSIDAVTAQKIIHSQMSLDEKIKSADHVVWNNGSPDVLARQSETLVKLWQTTPWTRA